MKKQNYKNHRRFVFLYHYITFFLILLLLASSIYYTIAAMNEHQSLKPGFFLFLISLILFSLFYHSRVFALKAQDRAIKAEEIFRHFILTGKSLNPKLTIRQIISLRFAEDEEFISLAQKAVENDLTEEEIKKEIKNWKGDYYRV